MWKIVRFWSGNRKTRFLHKNSASIKLRLLTLLKRNIYQTRPDVLLKALFEKKIICFVWEPSFKSKFKKVCFVFEIHFLWWNRVLCGNLVFLSKIENQFVLKISASIKLCLLDLFKRKIYQIQLGGLLKAPFAENITFFCLEIELLVQNWEIYFCAWNRLFVSKVMVYVKSCFFWLIIAKPSFTQT